MTTQTVEFFAPRTEHGADEPARAVRRVQK
jgi:hypothetical protein